MKSRVGYTVSLKLFVQADIGFFGVKISQSPPGSQGLRCAALGGLGKGGHCDVLVRHRTHQELSSTAIDMSWAAEETQPFTSLESKD